MRSISGRLPAALALGLFVCFVLTALPVAVVRSTKRIAQAVALWGEDARGAEVRTRGRDYFEAIERIRRAVPPDGAYFLVDGLPDDEGAAYWVRFDLAPRKPVLLGFWKDFGARREQVARQILVPGAPPRVVIARRDGEPPVLLDRVTFLRQLGVLVR